MKVRYWNDPKTKNMSASEIIEYEIDSVNSERGQLEDLEAKITKLTEIVADLVEAAGNTKAKEIINRHCFYHTPV